MCTDGDTNDLPRRVCGRDGRKRADLRGEQSDEAESPERSDTTITHDLAPALDRVRPERVAGVGEAVFVEGAGQRGTRGHGDDRAECRRDDFAQRDRDASHPSSDKHADNGEPLQAGRQFAALVGGPRRRRYPREELLRREVPAELSAYEGRADHEPTSIAAAAQAGVSTRADSVKNAALPHAHLDLPHAHLPHET